MCFTGNGATHPLFFGGGFRLLGIEIVGIAAVGAFVFTASALVWLLLKKTIGIRVSLKEEIGGLDIGERGNAAYPYFAILAPVMGSGNGIAENSVEMPQSVPGSISPEVAISVVNKARPGAKITKVTIIMNQNKFPELHNALDKIGVTGLTVTNVLGHGMQKGQPSYYRGAPVEIRLLPKVQVDIVIRRIPTAALIDTVKCCTPAM